MTLNENDLILIGIILLFIIFTIVVILCMSNRKMCRSKCSLTRPPVMDDGMDDGMDPESLEAAGRRLTKRQRWMAEIVRKKEEREKKLRYIHSLIWTHYFDYDKNRDGKITMDEFKPIFWKNIWFARGEHKNLLIEMGDYIGKYGSIPKPYNPYMFK